MLAFAWDLRRLTEQFAENAETAFRDEIRSALARALEEAEKAAKDYRIANPLS